jgi:hypothetical protein
MYGHQQDCARKAAERWEVQDLEAKLAHIYAAIEGGDDAADMTAPRGAFGVRHDTQNTQRVHAHMRNSL